MRKDFLIFIFAISLIISFSLVPIFVSADIESKPLVDIHVSLNGRNISDARFNAKLLLCYDERNPPPAGKVIPQLNISEYDAANNCYWKPAELAWGGNCTNAHCHFTYFLPSKFKLVVYLPGQDKVYLSNVIIRKNFKSTFEADLLSNGSIKIQETTPLIEKYSFETPFHSLFHAFIVAFLVTLFLELLVALIYFLITKKSMKILISVLIANSISLPIVWFVFPLFKIDTLLIILLAEIFALVFEACFIYLLNKDISLKSSFLLSFLMNTLSFFFGILLLLNFLKAFFPVY